MVDSERIPRRKKNYTAVERELWMLSGNECAHEGCSRRMVTETGAYVGEIAHIRGVGRTSPRHDPSMSDDDLRDKSNLILLCHDHHVETDNETRYPPKRMEEMKKRHESRFRKAYAEFEAKFTDYTDEVHPSHCRTLTRWLDVLHWIPEDVDGHERDEALAIDIEQINRIADKLSSLTEEARRAIAFVVNRGDEDSFNSTYSYPLNEMTRRTQVSKSTIEVIFEELNRHGFGYISWNPDAFEPKPPEVVVFAPSTHPQYHSEYLVGLRAYCRQTEHKVDEIITDLRFDLLDK